MLFPKPPANVINPPNLVAVKKPKFVSLKAKKI